MVSGNTSINRTTDASLEHEESSSRMSVVNLEAAIVVRDSYQVDKVAELGFAIGLAKLAVFGYPLLYWVIPLSLWRDITCDN